MATFNWLGGSMSDSSSWGPQPDPNNPVVPGANDTVNILMNGTLDGAISVLQATLNATLELDGSITTSGATVITGGKVTVNGGTNVSQDLLVQQGTYELDTGTVKVGSSHEYVGDINGQTAAFIQKGGTHTINGDLVMGYGGGTGSFDLSGGSFSSQQEYIGQNSTGTFTQTGGTHTVSDRIVLGINVSSGAAGTGTYNLGGAAGTSLSMAEVFIGSDPGCHGTFNYNVNAGDAATLSASGNAGYPGLIVGGQGIGIFNHGSGDVSTTISVGFRTGGTGTYNFNGGQITSTSEKVGDSGTGTFVHAAGNNTVTNSGLDIGASSGSNGTYQLQAGALKANVETVGDSGTGVLNQTGGTNEITTGALIVGNASGGDGTYSLHNGGVTIDAGDLTIGAQANSTGDFEFNAAAGDTGMLTITKGIITVADGGTGQFTLGNGDLTADVTIGSQTGSDGTFDLLGGTLTAPDFETIGDSGTGEFNQKIGTNTIENGNLYVGNNGGDGTYNLGGTGALVVNGGEFDLAVGGGSSGTFNFNTAVGDKATIKTDFKLITIGVHGAGTFIMGAGTLNAKLVVGGQVGGTGTFELDGGTVTAAGQTVGNDGGGTFNMNAGNDKITGGGDLIMGAFAAGGGTFNLVKGNLSDGGELVGYAGAGHIVQTGGSNKIAGTGSLLDLGTQANAVGTYVLSGGTLKAIEEVIGDAGNGTFTQSGKGLNTIAGAGAKLDIGMQGAGSGTYNLNASVLKAPLEIVGDGATGVLNQKGGTNTIAGTGAKLDIGAQATGNGSYVLSGGALKAPVEIVGDAGTGSFTQSGKSTNTISGTGAKLDIGAQSASHGAYALSGGTLKVLVEIVGDGGTGTFTQSGGSNTVTGTGSKVDVGAQKGSNGTYTLSGGGLKALHETVGDAGAGTFTQKGGTNTNSGVGAKLDLGAQSTGNGTYNLTTGTLKATAETIGEAGTGTFTEKAGTNALTAAMDVGAQKGSVGIYNLQGGVLTSAGETVGDSGTGTFNEKAGSNTIKGDLTIGNKGTGTYTLTGGSLTTNAAVSITGAITLGAAVGASGTLSVSKGTVKAPQLVIGSGGTGSVTVGKSGVVTIAKAIDISSGSSLNSALGAVLIGTGLTAKAGTIGVGTGGTLLGAGTVTAALNDSTHGIVEAHGGVLTISGAVTGGGTLSIDNGATLDLGGSDVDAVSFKGASGILRLEKASAMTGTITKLVIGDTIDLAGINATSAVRSVTTLSVTESGGAKLTFHVSGTFANTVWGVQSDGHGGTDVILQAKPASGPPAHEAHVADSFVYSNAAESTGASFATIAGFDARWDAFHLPAHVSGIDAMVRGGELTAAHFDADLAAVLDGNHLGANHAVIFRPTTGDFAGDTFLIVDANGHAGYQAGQDFVFELSHPLHLGELGVGDFV